MRAKVSVIISTFNYENYLETAINSVLNQTYFDWELVIVNDASTDNTAEILNRYQERVKVITNQANQGQAFSLNRGIEVSSGEYLAFLDADDYWDREKLTEQMKLVAEHSKTDVVLGSTENFFTDEFTENDKKAFSKPQSQVGYFLGSILVRRDFFDRVGKFDETCDAAPVKWFSKLSAMKAREQKAPEAICMRRIHHNNMTIKHKSKIQKAYISILKQKLAQHHGDR